MMYLKKKMSEYVHQVCALENKMDEGEQYSRHNRLRVFGCPEKRVRHQ